MITVKLRTKNIWETLAVVHKQGRIRRKEKKIEERK
jgi:hypothetical protein